MDYATGLGHRRSAPSPALSAHRPATVFLGIAIIEAPPAMPQESVPGDNAPAPAEPTVHTWRMVTFRREIRLCHETGVTQRSLMIRDDADTCWLACQMQHSRITTPGPAVINDPRPAIIQRRIDVDLFVVSLNRLHAVARLAAEVADPRNVLPAALDQFSDQTAGFPLSGDEPDQPATITSVRNARSGNSLLLGALPETLVLVWICVFMFLNMVVDFGVRTAEKIRHPHPGSFGLKTGWK